MTRVAFVRRILLASGCAFALAACGAVDEAMDQLGGLLPGDGTDEPEIVEEVAASDDVEAAGEEPGTVPEAEGAADDDPVTAEEDATAEADDAVAASGDLAVTPVRELTGGQVGEPIRVTYEITGPMATMMNEMIVSMDLDRQSVAASGADGAVYWARIDGDLVVCFDEGAWECLALPFGELDALGTGSLFGLDLYEDIPDLEGASTDVRDVQDETIAGRQATCVTVAESSGNAEFCLDTATGVLLRGSVTETHTTFGITAVDVGTPTDADFVPPAEPLDLEGLLGD